MNKMNKDENSIMTSETLTVNSRNSTLLTAGIQDAIGRTLIAHFDDIAKAPIPDRFLALLAELEAKENSDGR